MMQPDMSMPGYQQYNQYYQQPPMYSYPPPQMTQPMHQPHQPMYEHVPPYQPQNPIPNLNPIFKIPSDATHSLYIDGVPNDTNEREVSRIYPFLQKDIFRPFPGYQRVRLIRKQTQKGREYFLCFVDFEDAVRASIAMITLQGYRFDKSDKQGLKISYANNPKEKK